MSMKKSDHATHSPKDAVCDACGKPIPTGMGRRFRMKWRHEQCLPETRLRKITKFRSERGELVGEKRDIEHKLEFADKLKRRFG